MKTIITLAKEMQEQMTTGERKNGKTFYHLKNDHPQWMQDVIFAVHEEKLPDHTTYEFINDGLDIICDLEDNAHEDEIREEIFDRIEPDCYTSDLTGWLHERNDHVYYLTGVLEEMDVKDGFQALALAQTKHREDVALNLVGELAKLTD